MSALLTIGRAWRRAAERLHAAGIETATLDAKLLAGHALGRDGLALSLDEDMAVTGEAAEALDALIARRLAHEPVARILGEKEFYGLSFGLNAATLVPRPETEMLVDLGLLAVAEQDAPRVLDLGTGSGAILISVLAHRADARGTGVDLSPLALEMATANASRNGVGERAQFAEGSWFAPLAAGAAFDLIVSNPPYVRDAEMAHLDPEVSDHDPRLALAGGTDGLDPYRAIAAEARRFLRPGGALVLEHGTGQRAPITALLSAAGFGSVNGYDDLAGHDRVLVANG